MSDGRQQNHDLRLNLIEQQTHARVIAGILHVQRYLRCAQQFQPLIDHVQIQLALRKLVRRRVQREQIVDFKPVEDRHVCAAPLQLEGKVVTDEPCSPNQKDALAIEAGIHAMHFAIAALSSDAITHMSSSSRCGPTGRAID